MSVPHALRRALLLGCTAALLVSNAPAPEYDIVIRGGRVLDGAGNPWVSADVGIKDGRVARVGADRRRAASARSTRATAMSRRASST